MVEATNGFKSFVKAHREKRNWSRSELARRSELTQAEVSRLEAGKRMPTLRHVKHIATACHANPVKGDPPDFEHWVTRLVEIGDTTRKAARAYRRSP